MRVLYVSSVYKPAYVYGGVACSVPAMCEGLAAVGAGIEVFTTDANRRERLNVPLCRPVAVDGVPVTYFPVVSERYFYAPELVEAVRRQIHRFDVVEIDALFSSLLGPVAAVCRKAGIPYLVPPRGQLMPGALREKRWKKGLYLKLCGLGALNAAAGIHCTDPVEAESLAQAGVSAPPFVVPNGCEMRPPCAESGLIRAQIGIPDAAPLLLFVGRFHRVKRLDVAVATLAAIESAHLLLVGPDEQQLEPSLRKQAVATGCAARLHFLPLQPADSLRRIHAAADLFIMPSERESFGMAAAEAMAAGLPVLVSDQVPVGRWAQSAQGGVVARLDEFAETARRMLAMPRAELTEMGARARRCAASQFDRRVVARSFLDLVGQVVNLRPIGNRPLTAERPVPGKPIDNRPQDSILPHIEVIACPICETRDHERTYYTEHLPTRFVRCGQCRSVYLNPRPGAAARDSYYQGTERQVDSQLRVAAHRAPSFRFIAAALHRHKRSGAYLDVGCSTGAMFSHFDDAAWRRYGIEPDFDLASHASTTHCVPVHAGTLGDADFPASHFDLATLIDTIYLLPDPLASLRQIRGLLKPGGVVAVEFCGQGYMLGRSVGPLNYVLDGRWSRLRTDGRHLYFFTPNGVRRLLSMAGFKVLECIPIPAIYGLMTACSDRLLNYCPKLLCISART